MNGEQRVVPPNDLDPREFALQLAVVADRLDERSVLAVERVEAAGAAIAREAGEAARALAAERGRIAAARQAEEASRLRLLWIASAALLVGALVAVAGSALAVASARRELGGIRRDQMLLGVINDADVVLCDGRLCARLESSDQAGPEYRRVARKAGGLHSDASR